MKETAIDTALRAALKSAALPGELREVMTYAVLPAGKLFRPRLVEAIALDLDSTFSSDHLHLAVALELHHAYTLVHDDLPAMDNDLVRRGKPSTFAQFGEWQAILAGDALLIESFAQLLKIDHPEGRRLQRLFAWCTGAKGLILGQYLDLGAGGKISVAETVRVHELKTGRLIQAATVGAALLSRKAIGPTELRSFLRLGRDIGVVFQLLDDLTELTESNVSEHETSINPFLREPSRSTHQLISSHQRLKAALEASSLRSLEKMLREYFLRTQGTLLSGEASLSARLGDQELRRWITTFA